MTARAGYAQDELSNVATAGIARQTSDWSPALAAPVAINGNYRDFTATAQADDNAMWELEFPALAHVHRIVIHNRGDGCCQSRLRDLVVSVHDVSYEIDEPVDDLVAGRDPIDIDPLWDSAVFESDVLNLENELGGGGVAGPATLEIDLVELLGEPVSGSFVRILRIGDPDLSGTAGAGNLDEANVMSLGEVEVFGEVEVECPDEGDSHCEEIVVTPQGAEGEPGLYDVTVTAIDDSGDALSYTIIASHPLRGEIVVGPSASNTAQLLLGIGTWTIRAEVDDNALCDDEADDADCEEVVVEIENTTGNLALEGVASQSTDYNQNFIAHRAIDGLYGNFTATLALDRNPIWEVDLLEPREIGSVVLHNRGDGCCQSRLRDIVVSLHDVPFTEDEAIDDRVNDVPLDEIEAVWDSALFESEILNPENVLGGNVHPGGPDTLTIDVEALAGERVTARYVRVLRIGDPDNSGIAGDAIGGVDDQSILSLGEVEVFGESACANADPGDTHCEEIVVDGPPGDLAGEFLVTVLADDDSGDAVLYTITATEQGGAQHSFGPSEENRTTFELTDGTWTIDVEVSDGDACSTNAKDYRCAGVEVVVGPHQDGPRFVRGDVDQSNDISLTDGIQILNFLFLGSVEPRCLDAADASNNGNIELTDGVFVFNWLFTGGSPPKAPFPDCGPSPSEAPSIGCESFAACE